jgi:putative membrane protein
MMYGDWSWWWMLPMMLFMVLLGAAAIWAAVAVARSTGSGASSRRPEDIVHERFARGEIDPDEYAARLDALRHGIPRKR